MKTILFLLPAIITGVTSRDDKTVLSVKILDNEGNPTDTSYEGLEFPLNDELEEGQTIWLPVPLLATILEQINEEDITGGSTYVLIEDEPEPDPDATANDQIYGMVKKVIEQTDDQSRITVAVIIHNGEMVAEELEMTIATTEIAAGNTIQAEIDPEGAVVEYTITCPESEQAPGDGTDAQNTEQAPGPDTPPTPGDGTDNQPAQ